MRRLLLISAAALIPAAPGLAQQFQQVGSSLPGPVVWSEGVEVLDANGDGWLDVLFANGNGYRSAGGALAPTLLINHTVLGGPITFVDETAARLPPGYVQQAKSLTVCDVDGDGDTDVVFANAFGNAPGLLINDGTGHFTNEAAARFPPLSLNSFGAGFGDVDGDGDGDLVLSDEGPNTFGSPGGKVRLLLNDGTGHFSDGSAQLNAVNKIGAQNAQLVDIDNDFDLDLVVDGKSVGQQLYVNDGTGHFSLDTTTLPAGSAGTYATDFADLDNDTGLDFDYDVDGAYISLSGFNEGTARNNLVQTGSLSFTGSTGTLGGHNGDDDNDVAFLDANDDGLLDLLVGSLGNNQEKLYLNAGTFAPGSFVYQANGFTALLDSTLDLAIGDFDNDGRYDVVTAQGESGGFANRVYRNTGPADDRPPLIGRVQAAPALVPLSTLQAGGYVSQAWAQDATYKRGQLFVRASIEASAVKDGVTQDFTAPMVHVGGGIQRGVIQPPPSPSGTVGLEVSFSVHATDPNGNTSQAPPQTFRVCGAEGYGVALPNSSGQAGHVSTQRDPAVSAGHFMINAVGLPPGALGVLMVGTAKLLPGVPSGNGLRFVGGTLNRASYAFANRSGNVTLNVDLTQPPLGGVQPGDTRYFQLRFADPAGGGAGFNLSDALEVTFCD